MNFNYTYACSAVIEFDLRLDVKTLNRSCIVNFNNCNASPNIIIVVYNMFFF